MEPLPTFALEEFFAEWEFRARYHLTASDAQTCTVGELLEIAGAGALEDLLALPLGYLPTWGSDALREAIAATYTATGPEDVLTFCGAQEAMFWVLQELLGPGDHAVVTVPNYQSMESVPLATGAGVSGIPLWRGEGAELRWALDVDRIASAITERTRVVAVNLPNNPTGFVPDQQTWADLVAVCERRGVHLFADEVYRGVETDPAATLPAAVDLSELGISLDVTSKSLGLPGLRVGWVACRDRGLLARLEKRKHWTSISGAAPSELLATYAVRHAGVLRSRVRAVIAANRPLFDAFFADHADLFDWQAPDGGCVAFPRYRGTDGVEAFCAELLRERGVLLLPGSVYASRLLPVPADRFRIGIGRRDPGPALAETAAFLAGRRVRVGS